MPERPGPPPEGRHRPVRRRQLIVGGAGAVVLGGLALIARPLHRVIWQAQHPQGGDTAQPVRSNAASPYPASRSAPPEASGSVRKYVSTDASIPRFTVTTQPHTTTSAGLLFAAPAVSEYRGVIFDNDGEPVWIDTSGNDIMNLRVQQYRGEPVLTYWSGRIVDGYGQGAGTILDTRYRKVAEITAKTGLEEDLHEFLLTSKNAALITAYDAIPGDLTAVGGPARGYFWDAHVQEIDVATGRLLLDWRASEHLSLTESYEPLGSTGTTAATAYDPFHVNAIDVDSKGDGAETLLLSARHTHALYSIDRRTGAVRWRMNGKKSDFTLSPDAVFAWQHHVTRLSPSSISVFDNHVKYTAGASRGLILKVDESARTVAVEHSYRYRSITGTAQGSVQVLENGNVMVGWGTGRHGTEFTADGTPVYDVDFGEASYRVFRSAWSATPTTSPAIARRANPNGTLTVYVSWNGATEVAHWRIEAGADASSLTPATTVARAGFETSADIPSAARVRAVALNAAGDVIGSSPTISG